MTKGGIPKRSRYSFERYKPLLDCDFLISDHCCDINKKAPLKEYQKRTGRKPMIAVMADESFMRRQKWLLYGCNIFKGNNATSKPMSFWTEQDVLQYIVQNDLKIADCYGEIVPMQSDGQISLNEEHLMCTKCQRTGCYGCTFGMHMERSGETRFQKLARTHPKLYAYCINGGAYDPEDGFWKPTKEGLGFAHVFDEINRLIPTKTGRPYIRYLPEGGEMERARKLAEEKEKQ